MKKLNNTRDKKMVSGVANILKQIKDVKNRKDVFLNIIQDFEKEGVEYNKKDFKKRSNVFQQGGSQIRTTDTSSTKKNKTFTEYLSDVLSSGLDSVGVYGSEGTPEEIEQKRRDWERVKSTGKKDIIKNQIEINNLTKKLQDLKKGVNVEGAKETLKKMQALDTSTFNSTELKIYNDQIAELKKQIGFKTGGKLKLRLKSGGTLKHDNRAPDSFKIHFNSKPLKNTKEAHSSRLKLKSGGSVKDSMSCGQVKRSPRPGKKIVKLYCIDGKKKLVHAGSKEYTHEGKPSKSDSPAQKKRRANFHARHNCKDAKPGTAKHLACTELW